MRRGNFCNMVKRKLGMRESRVDVTWEDKLESETNNQATEDVIREVILDVIKDVINVSKDVIRDVSVDVQLLESENSNQITEDVQLDSVKFEDVISDVQTVSKNVISDVILDVECSDVILDVKCCATTMGTCSKHNIQLRKKKIREKYWGLSKNGACWKYRWRISWQCSESGFEALPNQPGGKN